MTAAAIEISGLRVEADERCILDIPRLMLAPGEVLGVLGPNGAGKSTLLRVMLGLQRPTVGDVRVLGEPVTYLRGRALSRLRCRIGYVPQQLAAHSQMPLTVREVVAIGRTGLAGLFRGLTAADWTVVDDAIDRVGLAGLRRAQYAQLSGGEQRKSLIARAMVQQPRLLLLDEPTAYLDLGWREHMVATLQRLYESEHVTTVLVCHELEVLPPCCRRVVVLN
ncbi:MAG: ATP-binding cassette domain-containing protein, partial [Phycisphaerae bacterium]|nr:ATP-binding cassette domain-containing protein [Phycisphaerae bacterium]